MSYFLLSKTKSNFKNIIRIHLLRNVYWAEKTFFFLDDDTETENAEEKDSNNVEDQEEHEEEHMVKGNKIIIEFFYL
jgi:hypothetical protein